MQVEQIHELALANGWRNTSLNERSRTFAKDDRTLTVWHRPKGRLSGIQRSWMGDAGHTRWEMAHVGLLDAAQRELTR